MVPSRLLTLRLIVAALSVALAGACGDEPNVMVVGGTPPPIPIQMDAGVRDASADAVHMDVDDAPGDAATDSSALPVRDPSVTGTHEVTTTSLSLTVSRRRVGAEVYHPVSVETVPLIVFDPGLLVPAAAYASLATHIASHGFAVVIPIWDCTGTMCRHDVWAEITHDVAATLEADDREMLLGFGVSGVGFMGHGWGGKMAILASGLRAAEAAAAAPVLSLLPRNSPAMHGGFSTAYPDGKVALESVRYFGVFGSTEPGRCAGTDLLPHESIMDVEISRGQTIYEWLTPAGEWADFLSEPGACGETCRRYCGHASEAQAEIQAAARTFATAFFAFTLLDEAEMEELLYVPAMLGDIERTRYSRGGG